MASAEDLRYGLTLGGIDPAALRDALGQALVRLAAEPRKAARAAGELALDELEVGVDVARSLLGADSEPVAAPDPRDCRFEDRAWAENPFLRCVLESYLVSSRSATRLLDSLELTEQTRRKARFALGLVLDALSPSNVPWLNPAVVKEAVDTGGLSVARGMRNLLEDLVRNGGQPRQVETSSFELGRNLAATPGRVVHRNRLIELLAYEPVTEVVFERPLLYSPPWINKYYVLDLSPGRSFVEYAVARGFTVFAISYRNPDASMSGVTLDDYLRDGLLEALDRASEITGSRTVNVVSLCVGGTLAAMGLAVLAARDEDDRIGWLTLLNSLVDFGEPGDIGVFTDEESVARIERRISRRGYLEPSELAGPFNWMKGNDLVWRYVVLNWQMGRRPQPFDILAWNADGTRLPAAMHAQYLRACYVENRLAEPNALELAGVPVDVGRIRTPLYVLGSEGDHIVPWRSSYRTTQLVSGEARHVLTAGGHVAGLIHPPGSPKAVHRSREGCPADPDEWFRGAEKVQGSWWEDWAAWAGERSGERVEPPVLPPGEPAPGGYVRG